MIDTSRNSQSDARFQPVGMGCLMTWTCWGCNKRRGTTLGAKGVGIKRRCAPCVEAQAERKRVAG